MMDFIMLHRQLEAMHRLPSYAARAEDTNEVASSRDRLTIALSCEAGVPVEEVAREVSTRLGWPVYNHELLKRIAEAMHCSVTVLEQLDEKHHSWLPECLGGFASPGLSQSQYACRLIQFIQSLGAEGRCLIVGRGAAFVLPWHSTLRIHLIGYLEDRIASLGRRFHLDRLKAQRCVRELDWEQNRFIRDYFGSDLAKPRNYDLVVNTSEWSAAACATLILRALQAKALANIPGRRCSLPAE
ncbi:MAG TPA: cytidylate kinase-like family protein [Gemmataceae bacterium]|jgi:cytidylate kinase